VEPPGPVAASSLSRSSASGHQVGRLLRRLVLFSAHPSAWWVAGIWGSVVCCAGTDSQWRWRNRALVAQAALWLLAALLFGMGGRQPGMLH